MNKLFLIATSVILCFNTSLFSQPKQSKGWKAGVASVVITPEYPMWMAGYASRNHPSEGTLHDLWAKALALEDADGKKVLLITSDLVGFTKILSDNICDRITAKYGLTRSQIALNSSHTHTGPEVDLEKFKWRMEEPDPEQVKKIVQYNKKLENDVVALAGKALGAMKPAKIYSGNGVARFQVNRRNNAEASIVTATDLTGPNDYAVPVIKVTDNEGRMIAVAFGYACHATVLDLYQWSGDFPGFAQIELEKNYPGTTALFFQGAGANQNPLPRRTVGLARQYGQELAFAAERVLNEEMTELSPKLSAAYSEIKLNFSKPPTKAELLKIEQTTTGLRRSWARYMLGKLASGKPLMTTHPYPLQVWKLGEQPVMILGGELVVDYTIKLKEIFGQNIFVLGYSNDPNMAYIPSLSVLNEGGYEGQSSQEAKGLPAKWAPDIEELIMTEMIRLSEKAGVPQVTSSKSPNSVHKENQTIIPL